MGYVYQPVQPGSQQPQQQQSLQQPQQQSLQQPQQQSLQQPQQQSLQQPQQQSLQQPQQQSLQQPQQQSLQQPQQQSVQQPQQQSLQQPQQQARWQSQPRQFTQSVSPETSMVVTALDRLETAAEFADSRAGQQGNNIVSKTADAMKDIAHVQKEFIVEENPLSGQLEQCTQEILQSGIQTLQQYGDRPEMMELVAVSRETIDAIDTMRRQAAGQPQHGLQQPQQLQMPGAIEQTAGTLHQ